MASTRVTEQKLVRVIDPSDWENPVFLAWVNKLGGWSFWLFKGLIEEKDKVLRETRTQSRETFINYEPWKYDIQYIEAWNHVLEREVAQGMTIAADNVDEDSRLRIRGIVHSPMVVYLKNPDTWDTLVSSVPVGPYWERVFIDGSLYDFGDGGQGSYDITLQITTQRLATLRR